MTAHANPSVAEVRASLESLLVREGPALGVGPGPYELSYVPNPGGFVNANFTVRSAGGAWHVKIAHPEVRSDLLRSWNVRDLLEARYHAPAALAWIRLESGLEGVVYRRVASERAHFDRRPELWPDVDACIARLNQDRELAERLGATPEWTCAEYLDHTWLDMLRADVAETRVHDACPPFVGEDFWAWALEQVDGIRAEASRQDAFAWPADAVVHGDLWYGNVLASDEGWWIVDWDDLGPGDPAKDVTDWWWDTSESPRLVAAEVSARLPLWHRTRRLVDAVDPLADWAEAIVAPPEVRETQRAESRALHEDAFARYRRDYG